MDSTKRFGETILLEDIPDEGLSLLYEEMPGVLADVDDCRPDGPVRGEVALERVNDLVTLRGKLKARVVLACHRCLDEYTVPIEMAFSQVLVADESKTGGRDPQKEEEQEVSQFDGIHIPLGEIFREQILLQLPMQALCREDCRGLCPGCGADLNREACRCQATVKTSPFAVLKKLPRKA